MTSSKLVAYYDIMNAYRHHWEWGWVCLDESLEVCKLWMVNIQPNQKKEKLHPFSSHHRRKALQIKPPYLIKQPAPWVGEGVSLSDSRDPQKFLLRLKLTQWGWSIFCRQNSGEQKKKAYYPTTDIFRSLNSRKIHRGFVVGVEVFAFTTHNLGSVFVKCIGSALLCMIDCLNVLKA